MQLIWCKVFASNKFSKTHKTEYQQKPTIAMCIITHDHQSIYILYIWSYTITQVCENHTYIYTYHTFQITHSIFHFHTQYNACTEWALNKCGVARKAVAAKLSSVSASACVRRRDYYIEYTFLRALRWVVVAFAEPIPPETKRW